MDPNPHASQPPAPFIARPLNSVPAWVAAICDAELPVLPDSAGVLEDMRRNQDAFDAHSMAEAFGHDPLMTLKILAKVSELRRGREGSHPETVTAALVMLGVTPFFHHFGPQVTCDRWLDAAPYARAGFEAVLERSRRAARFALAFAVHRMDHDAAVIQEAALLHDFAELLLWLRAPQLLWQISGQQTAHPGLRSVAAQREVLNVAVNDLQHALMQRWRLPPLLIDITDDNRERTSPQARNVLLAIRLARHTAVSWDNAAIPDDIADIADLLHMAPEPTLALVQDIDGH